MSKENAKDFVQAILNDEELRQRTEKMKPEDAVPLGKEMGYDFTVEELKEAGSEVRELSPEELENVAGGDSKAVRDGINQHQRFRNKINQASHCHGDIHGSLHNWVKTGQHVEEPILNGWLNWLGSWSIGYDQVKCTLCGDEQWVKS